MINFHDRVCRFPLYREGWINENNPTSLNHSEMLHGHIVLGLYKNNRGQLETGLWFRGEWYKNIAIRLNLIFDRCWPTYYKKHVHVYSHFNKCIIFYINSNIKTLIQTLAKIYYLGSVIAYF